MYPKFRLTRSLWRVPAADLLEKCWGSISGSAHHACYFQLRQPEASLHISAPLFLQIGALEACDPAGRSSVASNFGSEPPTDKGALRLSQSTRKMGLAEVNPDNR